MAGDIYLYQQIASRTAVRSGSPFSRITDTLTVINTCRNGNLDLLSGRSIAGAAAGTAFLFDHFSCSAAFRTGLYVPDHAEHRLLGIYDLTFAMTFRTGYRPLCPALPLFRDRRYTHPSGQYPSSFSQPKTASSKVLFTLAGDLLPSLGRYWRVSCFRRQTDHRKYRRDIAHIRAVEVETAEAAGSASSVFKCSMAELVVLLSLFWIAEDSIRFRSLFKFCLCNFYHPDLHPGDISWPISDMLFSVLRRWRFLQLPGLQ